MQNAMTHEAMIQDANLTLEEFDKAQPQTGSQAEDDDRAGRIPTKGAYARVFVFAWGYWSKRPFRIATLITLALVTVFGYSMLPYFSGQLIDVLSGNAAEGRSPMGPLTGFLISAAVLHIALQINLRIWIFWAAELLSEISMDSFNRVQRFSTDWHANSFAGSTVRKITRGMWSFDEFQDTLFWGLFHAALMVVVMTSILTINLPSIGIGLAFMTLAFVVVNVWLSIKYVAPANQDFIAKDSKMGGGLADAITCNAVVKAFGAERREEAAFRRLMAEWRAGANKSWSRQIDVVLVQQVLRLLLQGGMLSAAVYAWSMGAATSGQVVLIVTSYFVLDGYLRELGFNLRNLQQSVNEIEDIVDFADQDLGVEDNASAYPLDAHAGEIRFENVSFTYENQEDPLYNDFSLQIAAGEKVALVGRSGSGKTSFVKLVQRLYDIQSGAIRIDDQDIAHVTQESLRQAMAIVPQEPVLFHRSLAENISYARPGATQAEIERAAEQAHADEFIRQLKDGYDTLVGERGIKLSGGERQRIALARAFLADTPLLILDEATSSLDSITEAKIQDAVTHLMEGRTTILIAHRLSTIQAVDRVLVFADGKVVEQGSPAELQARPEGHYASLYQAQARGEAVL